MYVYSEPHNRPRIQKQISSNNSCYNHDEREEVRQFCLILGSTRKPLFSCED